MVWAGSQTITKPPNRGHIKIVATGFDANTEVATAIDIEDYTNFAHPIGGACSMSVDQSAGTTAVVAISLQGSFDNSTWLDIVDLADCEATGTSDAIGGCAHDSDALNATFQYYRIYCTTVGAGNTLTATAIIRLPGRQA